MKTTQSPESAPPPRKRRRWPWILGGLLALLLIGAALLPAILSTGPVRRMVLGRVNRQLNGKVEVDSWSLSWFSGIRIHNVRVTDAQGDAVAEIGSISVPASLPGLLRGVKRLGTVEVNQPRAYLVLRPDGSTNLDDLVKPAAARKPPSKPQPLGLDVQGQLQIRDGSVTVRGGEKGDFVLSNLNTQADITGLSQPVPFTVSATIGETGVLEVTGEASLLHEGVLDPQALKASLGASVLGVRVGPVAGMAKQFGLPVNADGHLNAHLSVSAAGLASIRALGEARVREIVLSGGPLGADKLQMQTADLKFDVVLHGDAVQVREFNLETPLATASAQGNVMLPKPGALPRGDLTAQATVDLAALAAQLPRTLKLREGLVIRSGSLALDAKMASGDAVDGLRLEANMRLENLAAEREGKTIAMEKPILLAIRASQDAKGARLDHLELTSSFAQAQGSGDFDKFDLTLTSDLQAATAEAAKFVDLGGRSLKGAASLEAHIVAADQGSRKLTVAGEMKGLELTAPGGESAKLDHATLSAEAFAELDANNLPKQFTNVSLTLAAAPGDARFSAESIAPVPGKPLPALTGGSVSFHADLAQVAALARALKLLPADEDLSGTLSGQAKLSCDGEALRADGMEADVRNLVAALGRKSLREPSVRVTGAMEIRPAQRTAALRDWTATLSSGEVRLPRAEIADWAAAPAGLTADLTGQFDIQKLLVSAGDFVTLPKDTAVSGQADFDVKVKTDAQFTTATVTAALKQFRLTAPGVPPVEEEKIAVEAVARFDAKAGAVKLSQAKVDSRLLQLTADAELTDLSGAMQLHAKGTLAPDFDRLAPLVSALTGQQIVMSGHQSRAFDLRTPLAGKTPADILRETLASAGVYIEKAQLMGMTTGAIELPLNVAGGIAALKIETTLNGGRLLLPLRVDATGLVAFVTLPQKTAILDRVQITSDMADQIISRASPLFKGAVVSTGRISLTGEQLRALLDSTALNQATFAGELAFEGVELRSAGLIKTILDLASLGEKTVQLPDQRLAVTLRDGRFHQAPMIIRAAGYSFGLSGSVGLDTTLDLQVDLPITRDMVGGNKDLYELLKGETIKVPIRGTASAPEIGRDVFRRNLRDLTEAAAKNLIQKKGAEMLLDMFNKKRK